MPNRHSIREALEGILSRMVDTENELRHVINGVHPSQRSSAANLIDYLVLRNEDIRPLQDHLHVLGLSSLASSESHIRRQVQSVLERLGAEFDAAEISPLTFQSTRDLINRNALHLFGNGKSEFPFVMVTLDKSFAFDTDVMHKLIRAGMNVARINCAHDGKDVWRAMVDVVRQTSEESKRACKIYMDLAGPKMRTVLMSAGRSFFGGEICEGQYITRAESDAEFDPDTLVVGCLEPGIVNQVNIGERILFDDGVVEAVVTSKGIDTATLKIRRVSSKKFKLVSNKGLNFPDTSLSLPSLTDYDKSIVSFICDNADMVGYSFVKNASDVELLQDELEQHENKPHIILKIETSEAVHRLPSLLLQGMRNDLFGVMIARGDLAVEIGFERMSEIQEEILWLCEAAHVPVIWATQVLETLNKKGIATRSEVTDASHAVMAECVLLNKGPHILRVIETLRDILRRSGTHHAKKRYTMRPMQIAKQFFQDSKQKSTVI